MSEAELARWLELLRTPGFEYGRKLPRLLREEGLLDIGADGHLAVMGGEALRRLEEANTLQVRDALLSISPLISAWGRRAE